MVKGRKRRSGGTDDETVGLHHPLNGHEFEQSPGDKNRNDAVHVVTKMWTWLSGWVARVEGTVAKASIVGQGQKWE